MSEEARTSPELALSWEEWLRQGLLTPEIVARLQAISRRRMSMGAHRPTPQGDDEAADAGGER